MPGGRSTINLSRLIKAVSYLFGVCEEDVLSRARTEDAVEARQWVYYVLYRTGLCYIAIGQQVGRHHSTIMRGVRRAQGRLKTKEGVVMYRELMDLMRRAA